MHHGNGHGLAQCFLNQKTFRRLDVLQIDAAEGRLNELAEFDDVFRVFGIYFQVKDVDIGKRLKSTALPSITGLPARAPMLPRPSTAVPFETTATRLARAVYSKLSSGFFSISRQGSATPGV